MKNSYKFLLTTLIIASTISCTKKSEDAATVAVTKPSLSYTSSTGKYGTVGSMMSVVPSELTENGSSIINCSLKEGTTALPTWASINATTCVISGTPTAGLNPTVYTLVATNTVGNSPDATVTLAVSVDIVDPIGLVINAGETEAYIYDNLSGCLKIDLVNGTNSFLNTTCYNPIAFDD